ncbi:MAG: acyl-CoA thioesterase [Mariprofundaceae bacterium]
MSDVAISATRLSIAYTVQDDDLNGYRVLHGGRLLTLADEVGFLAAHTFCGRDCLTVAVHQAQFHRPCLVQEAIDIQAQVGLTGNSSIWVTVDVVDNQQSCVMNALIVYVAVDEQRRPLQVGQVQAETAQEIALQKYIRKIKARMAKDA